MHKFWKKLPPCFVSYCGVHSFLWFRLVVTADDVSLARDRLRGALHLLLDPSETCGNDECHKTQQAQKRKQDELLQQMKQEQILAKQEEKKAA